MKLRHLSCSLALLGMGCAGQTMSGAPVTPTTVSAHATASITGALTQTVAALGTLQSLSNVQTALSGLSNIQQSMNLNTSGSFKFKGMSKVISKLKRLDVVDPSMGSSVNMDSNTLSPFLTSNVFVSSNIETQDSTQVTYLMHGDTFCSQAYMCAGMDPSVCAGMTADPNCVATTDALQLRIHVTAPSTTALNLAFEVGPNKISPFVLDISQNPDTVAGTLDLGQAKSALVYAQSVDPGDFNTTGLPTTCTGSLQGSVTVNGNQDVTMAFAVVSAVNVVDSTGDTLAMAASNDFFTAHVQGLLGKATFGVDAKAIDIGSSWAQLISNPAASAGLAAFHLAGASVNFSLDGNNAQSGLVFSNVGLGDGNTTLSKDGNVLLQVSINNGSTFSLSAEPNAMNQTAVFTFTPGLVVNVLANFAPVQADMDVPSYFLNDTIGFSLTGSPSASLLPLPTDTEVVNGTLVLTHNSFSVEVDAQSCVVPVQDPPQDADPMWGSVQSGTCQ